MKEAPFGRFFLQGFQPLRGKETPAGAVLHERFLPYPVLKNPIFDSSVEAKNSITVNDRFCVLILRAS